MKKKSALIEAAKKRALATRQAAGVRTGGGGEIRVGAGGEIGTGAGGA
jgi:hypothetical protein